MKSNMKNQNKKKSHIPFRLNLLFFVVFLLFASLILRLGYLQIVKGEEYETEVKRTETTLATGSVPRGEIYDSQHQKLVANEPLQAITYTRGKGISTKDMADIALKLANYIDMPHITQIDQSSGYDISKRDLQDYWLVVNQDEARERLTEEEEKMSGSELYRAQIAHVLDEDLQFTDTEKEAAAIFKRMNGAYALTTINIKSEDVTDQEIAKVSENLLSLPGVGTGTDWVRSYPQGSMLKSILGSVTSESEGLPASQVDAFLAKGYARNDRVGKSYLEQQYEDVLSGTKSKSETETNRNGDVVNTIQKYVGEKGDNLVLTIDIDFQEKVQEIAKEALINNRQGLNDRIYVMASNPKTGEILAMTGQQMDLETGEIVDHTLGNLTSAFSMGSAVKGATVLAGYMEDVVSVDDNVIVDEPLVFRGPIRKSSVFNRTGRVAVDDIKALEVSSNVYMIRLAMRMGGQYTYTPNGPLSISATEVVTKLREYYAQFGLGVETGIDLPNEAFGIKGPIIESQPGNALDFSFGQFDTYTPIQLLQYVNTIANGGYRIAPRLVKEIRDTADDGTLGTIETQFEPRILNTIDVEKEEFERVQQGFYQVVHGSEGTARSAFAGAPYESAGKTGTAQAVYYGADESKWGTKVINRTYVGYAPYDDPEIAITVIVPYLPLDTTNHENTAVARQVMDAYFQVGNYTNPIGEDTEESEEEAETDLEIVEDVTGTEVEVAENTEE